jgi:recombination protein RecT
MTQIQKSTKHLFDREDVRAKFNQLLGQRASQFITSVLQIVASNKLLTAATPESVYHAAVTAATLDLPLNNNLGFAYIIPYKSQGKDVAQFQIGYKGFIQLAQRSGQIRRINACPVYEGQLTSEDPLMGHSFDWSAKKSETVIGYVAYFELLNGYQHQQYMTVEQLNAHGKRFSQSYRKGFGLWKDDFHSMAMKTVLKLMLSKYAPLSVDIQRAIVVDQAVIKDAETQDVDYVDAEEPEVDKELERICLMIEDCTSVDELDALAGDVPDEAMPVYLTKLEELTKNG